MTFLCEILGHTLPKAGASQSVPRGSVDEGPFDYVTLPDRRAVRVNCGRCARPFTVCTVIVSASGREQELEQFVVELRRMVNDAKAREPHPLTGEE